VHDHPLCFRREVLKGRRIKLCTNQLQQFVQEEFIVHEALPLTHSDSPVSASAMGDYRAKPWMQSSALGGSSKQLESSSGVSQNDSEAMTDALKQMIQSAVVKMQLDVKEELSEEDIVIHGVLGQGAFGTVYRGACRGCTSIGVRGVCSGEST
jgi:hypothetical protein